MLENILSAKPQQVGGVVWTEKTLSVNPGKLYLGGGAVIDDKFYLIGGNNGTRWVRDIQVYNPATNTLQAVMSGISVLNNWVISVVYRGRILLIPIGEYSGTTFWFDPLQEALFTGPNIGILNASVLAATVIGDKLYLIAAVANKAVMEIDLITGTPHVFMASVGESIYSYYLSCVAVGTDIYCIGGGDSAIKKDITKIDTINKTASVVAQLPIAAHGGLLYLVNDEIIHYAGGRSATGVSDSVEAQTVRVFNYKTNEVTVLPELMPNKHLFSCFGVSEKTLYSFGGYLENTATLKTGVFV